MILWYGTAGNGTGTGTSSSTTTTNYHLHVTNNIKSVTAIKRLHVPITAQHKPTYHNIIMNKHTLLLTCSK